MKSHNLIFAASIAALLCLVVSCVNRKATANLPENSYSFGPIKMTDSLYHSFPVVNAGNAPLMIKNASGSCDCISLKWSGKEILPGDTGYVSLHFLAKASGVNKKTVVVETNATNPFSTFTFQAEVFD